MSQPQHRQITGVQSSQLALHNSRQRLGVRQSAAALERTAHRRQACRFSFDVQCWMFDVSGRLQPTTPTSHPLGAKPYGSQCFSRHNLITEPISIIMDPELEDSDEESRSGNYMELEKRLYETGAHSKKIPPKGPQKETNYEDNRRRKRQRTLSAHGRPPLAKNKHHGHQAGAARTRATDWEDFADAEPGYSGHQARQVRGRVLQRENLARKPGQPSRSIQRDARQ